MQVEEIQEYLINNLARSLKIERDEIDLDKPFADYYEDPWVLSDAEELFSALFEGLEVSSEFNLDALVLFDFPTIDRLTTFLSIALTSAPNPQTPKAQIPNRTAVPATNADLASINNLTGSAR